MPLVPDTLPTDIDELQRLVLEQQQHLDLRIRALAEKEQILDDIESELALNRELLEERDKEIVRLQEQLTLLLAKRYLHSSEKLDGIQGQLFDESELQQEIAELEQQIADAIERKNTASSKNTSSSRPAAPPARKALPDHLRRVDIEVSVSDEDLQMMGDEWELIGYEFSEQLAVHEREYYVKRYKRAKWIRKHRKDSGQYVPGEHDIRVAPPAPVMLPRSLVDATFLAKIVTGKFIDGLSFNRELKVLEREGVQIGYSTLCSYPIQLHQRLQPLEKLFYAQAAQAYRWHLDETTVQVLQEPGREARTKSHMWAMRAELSAGTLVLFHYDERRNYEALENWLAPSLETFEGVIVSDEHKPYARLASEYENIAARGGCWSHCRRKYVDAVKGRRAESDAHRVLKYIAKLYELNDRTGGLQGEALVSARQKLILPWARQIPIGGRGFGPAVC